MTKSPILYDEKVREFYYTMEFNEDGSLNTLVGVISFYLNEERLGEILDMNYAEIPKKLMKGDYQLLFEFFNKVILPRFEKRAVASAADLFLKEALCKFDPLNLSTLMLEHMHKIVVEQKGKHDMGYGYFLTKLFKQLDVPVGAGL
ncbi:hypothetical protein R3W88_016390 [Solanum pinnatisectum]|uniref:Uncharacterized protein n=1 Tax=Solanum pinnatisectum TaxID=50273 RepID=A0AAV9KYE4_9SOLN|nr:hypothetical protein R3W88_016390 [Solanum pinnatisectum]